MIAKMQKHSKQRDAIMAVLKSTKSHPNAEWLYQEIKKEFPNISPATVYRNLNLLLSKKQILRLSVGDGTEHYDANCENHYHLFCKGCGSIIDINFPLIANLEEKVERLNNISIDEHSLIFYGMCPRCKKA